MTAISSMPTASRSPRPRIDPAGRCSPDYKVRRTPGRRSGISSAIRPGPKDSAHSVCSQAAVSAARCGASPRASSPVTSPARTSPDPAVARRSVGGPAESAATQQECCRHGNPGVDQGEEWNDEQGGQERIALGPVGEPFTSGAGGVDWGHRWGRVSAASRGERVRAEAGRGTPPEVSRMFRLFGSSRTNRPNNLMLTVL